LDKVVPVHVPKGVANLIKRGRVVTVDGAGHLASTGATSRGGRRHVFEFPTMIAEDDTVALEWRVQARNITGQPYDNDYCGFFVVRRGKIVAVREYLDTRYAAKLLFADLE
jgi:ketosteroid isomerase-like protein